MRDITKHPVTRAEQRRALVDAILWLEGQGMIGDVRPLALRMLLIELDQAKGNAP